MQKIWRQGRKAHVLPLVWGDWKASVVAWEGRKWKDLASQVSISRIRAYYDGPIRLLGEERLESLETAVQ